MLKEQNQPIIQNQTEKKGEEEEGVQALLDVQAHINIQDLQAIQTIRGLLLQIDIEERKVIMRKQAREKGEEVQVHMTDLKKRKGTLLAKEMNQEVIIRNQKRISRSPARERPREAPLKEMIFKMRMEEARNSMKNLVRI